MATRDIVNSSEVCKLWNKVAAEKFVLEYSFGKEDWEKHFGKIGDAPELPSDIYQTLMSDCPFVEGKKIHETHILVLIPSKVGETPFCINSLDKMIKDKDIEEKKKIYQQTTDEVLREFYLRTKCTTSDYGCYIEDSIANAYGTDSPDKPYWVLMKKDIIEGSRGKTREVQLDFKNYQSKGYEAPSFLEAATCILMHEAKTNEKLFAEGEKPDDLNTYVCCKDKPLGQRLKIIVGNFSDHCASVQHYGYHDFHSRREEVGAGCLKKL